MQLEATFIISKLGAGSCVWPVPKSEMVEVQRIGLLGFTPSNKVIMTSRLGDLFELRSL